MEVSMSYEPLFGFRLVSTRRAILRYVFVTLTIFVFRSSQWDDANG